MFPFIVRKLIKAFFIVFLLSMLIFFVIRIMPGDPASLIAPQADEATKAQIRESLGLNDPLVVQYVKFVKDAARGNFGQSIYYKKPVVLLIGDVLPLSLLLVFGALCLSSMVSIPLGVMSATRPESVFDRGVLGVTILLQSAPNFWLGLILIMLLAINYKFLPGFGYKGWEYTILPILTLAAGSIPLQLRTVRLTMEDILSEEYVYYAKARGIRGRLIVWKYALKNTVVPLMSILGLQVGLLLGGLLIVEYVFTFPGIGLLALYAVQRRDYQLIQGVVIVFSTIICIANIGVDVLQLSIDPRMRKGD